MSTFIPNAGDKVKFIAQVAPKHVSKNKEYEVFAGYNKYEVMLYIILDNDRYMYFDELFCEGWELV